MNESSLQSIIDGLPQINAARNYWFVMRNPEELVKLLMKRSEDDKENI